MARRALEGTPRVPSRSAGEGANPQPQPLCTQLLGEMDGCTRPHSGLGCRLVLRRGPGQTRGQGGTREPLGLARLRGARERPRRGAVTPRPPPHPREGPPKIPLSLSRARGRGHPSCRGRVTRPGSPRPGGKDGSCSVWESARGAGSSGGRREGRGSKGPQRGLGRKACVGAGGPSPS